MPPISTLLLLHVYMLPTVAVTTFASWSDLIPWLLGWSGMPIFGLELLAFPCLVTGAFQWRMKRLHQQVARLRAEGRVVPWRELVPSDLWDRFEAVLGPEDIEFLVSPATRGGSPRAMIGDPFAERPRQVVAIPPTTLEAFQGHGIEMAALLAHEVAHHRHRDLPLVRVLPSVLGPALWFFAIFLLAKVFRSAVIDSEMVEPVAIQAGAVGRSYALFVAAVVASLPRALRTMVGWREALADRYAIRHLGVAALRGAETLIEGAAGTTHGTGLLRPTPDETSASLRLEWWEHAWIGALTKLNAGLAAGGLMHVAQLVDNGTTGTGLLRDLATDIGPVIILGTLVWLLAAQLPAFGEEDLSLAKVLRLIGTVGLTYLIGAATLGLVEVNASYLPTYGMPNGYPVPNRYFLAPLLGTTIYLPLHRHFSLLCLAAVTIFLAAPRRPWLSISLPFIWIGSTILERLYFPQIWLGAGAFVLLSVIVALRAAVVFRDGRRARALIGVLTWCVFLGLSLSGTGDLGHRGLCALRASGRHAIDNDLPASELAALAATRSAPWIPSTWVQLAATRGQQGKVREALHALHRAAEAPFLDDHPNLVRILTLEGQLRLKPGQHFSPIGAQSILNKALELHRGSPGLRQRAGGKRLVAGLMYLSGLASWLVDRDPRRAAAGVYQAVRLGGCEFVPALDDGFDAHSLSQPPWQRSNAELDQDWEIVTTELEAGSTPLELVDTGLVSGEVFRVVLGAELRQCTEPR